MDAESYIKIFTFKTKEEIESLIASHREAPHERKLQKALAEALTLLVHNHEALTTALEASEILFGKSDISSLNKLSKDTMEEVFEGVPSFEIEKSILEKGVDITNFLVEHTGILPSNAEAKRALKENSLSINKDKVGEGREVNNSDLLQNGYILVQRGKKNYFLVKTN
ncbi:MAG: hypothetical protein R2772_08400 [Chitinophagales bacterium]